MLDPTKNGSIGNIKVEIECESIKSIKNIESITILQVCQF